mgnify:CR=1 FL=1
MFDSLGRALRRAGYATLTFDYSGHGASGDEIITFDQLDLAAIKLIIDIELRSLFKRVKELGYDITITDKAKEFVATKGYDVQFGARPLKRAIQNYIEDGICERILAGKVHEGDTIAIGKNPNADELTFK